MPSTTVIATIPAQQVNSTLDNLVEADFSEADISLVMENSADARRLIADGGPLHSETAQTLAGALRRLGVAQASSAAGRVNADTALIAVSAGRDSADAAREILSDAGATLIEAGS